MNLNSNSNNSTRRLRKIVSAAIFLLLAIGGCDSGSSTTPSRCDDVNVPVCTQCCGCDSFREAECVGGEWTCTDGWVFPASCNGMECRMPPFLGSSPQQQELVEGTAWQLQLKATTDCPSGLTWVFLSRPGTEATIEQNGLVSWTPPYDVVSECMGMRYLLVETQVRANAVDALPALLQVSLVVRNDLDHDGTADEADVDTDGDGIPNEIDVTICGDAR